MAFVTNSLNFPNLPSKASPVGADLFMLADSADSNKLKQATLTSMLAAAAAGALTKVATATAAGVSTLDFNACFSATYDNYLIVWENWVASSTVFPQARVGTGAGPTFQATNDQGTSITAPGGGAVSGITESTTQFDFSSQKAMTGTAAAAI